MPTESTMKNDRRGLIFTIEGNRNTVYQVRSCEWARDEHRWHTDDIPPEILAKVDELGRNKKPGAFARFGQEDRGVYVIDERNISTEPAKADDDVVFDPYAPAGRERTLSACDIVIRAKGGQIEAENGEIYDTEDGQYYVVKSDTWGRFVPRRDVLLPEVNTTVDFLGLLDRLNGKNYLSMTPDDPPRAALPQETEPIVHINCYVLNLARFTVAAANSI